MPHRTPLISAIVAALVLAFVLGAIANRFRISPLVGYLLAGVLIGPFTPGFVADQGAAADLAEIGIILLMFGVGLHETVHLKTLGANRSSWATRRSAWPCWPSFPGYREQRGKAGARKRLWQD